MSAASVRLQSDGEWCLRLALQTYRGRRQRVLNSPKFPQSSTRDTVIAVYRYPANSNLPFVLFLNENQAGWYFLPICTIIQVDTSNFRQKEVLNMKICGLQKTTLLDFPGHVAATVFTGGCNFRCPFCHNSELLRSDAPSVYTIDEILSFLARRKGIVEGIAVTGGEPTLQPDLRDFLADVQKLGYRIKLDTNGYRPETLRALCEEGLIDYVAMDIKTCKERYAEVSGIPSVMIEKIEESVEFLKAGLVPYEFRTTVVQELHTSEDFKQIGPWLRGSSRYFLQSFTDSGNVLKPGFTGCTKEELTSFLALVKPFVGQAALRGVDG